MRILEARFHPDAQVDGQGIVVGHVHCAARRATVEAEPAALPRGGAAAMLRKLQYLVDICAPAPFERLRQLRSRYWSFVEVPAPSAKQAEDVT
ncbi:MAG TPA: hypothetical protein VMU50_10735 [Polyangia bacterium]|nr:hypothetical protein [Polyangia bacterium]